MTPKVEKHQALTPDASLCFSGGKPTQRITPSLPHEIKGYNMCFQQVERAFITKGISRNARLTLLYLAKFAGSFHDPTAEELAELQECSVDRIYADFRELKKAGKYMPVSTKGGRGVGNPYQLMFEDFVVAKVAKDYNKGKKARIAKAKVIHIHTRQEVKVDELPDFLFKEING